MRKIDKRVKNLHWYALTFNMNTDKLENFDIFRNIVFCECISDAIKKDGKTRDELKSDIRSACMHEFWSRCEYESVISPLINRGEHEAVLDGTEFTVIKNWYSDTENTVFKCANPDTLKSNRIEEGKYTLKCEKYNHSQKIDVWRQIEPNLDILVDYIIANVNYKLSM